MEADEAPYLWVLLLVGEASRLHRLTRQLPAASGMRPVSAGTLSECACVLSERPIDVIVADLSLPDGAGLEVVHRIRAWAPRVPLVVLSGAEGLTTQAIRAGAEDYLSLDGGHRTLPESIRYALERRQASSRLRAAPSRPQLASREIVSLRGGRWGAEIRHAGGGGGDTAALLRAGLTELPGRVLVSVEAPWFAAAGWLEALSGVDGLGRAALGVADVPAVAEQPRGRQWLSRFRGSGGLVFALDAGERPLGELVSMPLDGLVLAPSVCVLAQARRGAPLVRALVSLAEACGWHVLGTGEALRFLGCGLIRRAEWTGLQ